MLAARGHVVPAPARWANGRIRLRSIEIARGARRYSAGDGDPKPDSNPKSNGKGFSFGASTASPGPRAGEPRPEPPPIPKVDGSISMIVKTLWRSVSELGDTLAEAQRSAFIYGFSFNSSKGMRPPSTFRSRNRAEILGETHRGNILSHSNKRYAFLKQGADPDSPYWQVLPMIAEHIKVKETYKLSESAIEDEYVKPWEAFRKARERIFFLRKNWPAIPEDIKQTIKWDEWVFPAGRVDLFQYENFDPNTLIWTDIINKMLKLMAEHFGIGISEMFNEPEKGGPKEDPLQDGYDASELDEARRMRATKIIDRELALKQKRDEVTYAKWQKERDDWLQSEATKQGVTLDEMKVIWTKMTMKTGTYWAEFFTQTMPKEGQRWMEGRYMEGKDREVTEAQAAQRAAVDDELDTTFVVDNFPIELEEDPKIKPFAPDSPEVVAKVIAEIREEIASKDRELPDPHAKTWLKDVLDRQKILKELKEEKKRLKQEVLNSGDVMGYVQLQTKDRIFGGTFEMVGSTAEMLRIRKLKGHPGVFGRVFAWLINQPYRLRTADFPSETWIPPFEQDPDRYSLRAYPDPFEISTWRFRRTETGFIGRIADWFSFRNNGKQWWWMPGDQHGIRRFELWWQEYKETDDFWTKVAPHVLKTSWFRRYVMEYFTGAEWRTMKDMRNLEDFALNQQEYSFKALQHLYPKEKLDFDLYRRVVKGETMKGVEIKKPDDEDAGHELRWGPSREFREASVDPATGSVTSPGWLLATSGTRKMNLREALEVLGYGAQLKAGILPPLDEVKTRADQLDAANQTESSKVATGWRRVVRELLRDPLLEPKVLEMHEIATKTKAVVHSGKSPYLGGKAHASYLAIERAHRGEILFEEDEIFMKTVRENLAAEAAKANAEAEGKKPAEAEGDSKPAAASEAKGGEGSAKQEEPKAGSEKERKDDSK